VRVCNRASRQPSSRAQNSTGTQSTIDSVYCPSIAPIRYICCISPASSCTPSWTSQGAIHIYTSDVVIASEGGICWRGEERIYSYVSHNLVASSFSFAYVSFYYYWLCYFKRLYRYASPHIRHCRTFRTTRTANTRFCEIVYRKVEHIPHRPIPSPSRKTRPLRS
jgi:hypothetical protein